MTAYHVPVLLQPTLALLKVQPSGWYVDATLGGGGHTRGLLDLLGPNGRLWACDQDPDAWAQAPADARLQVLKTNFGNLTQALTEVGLPAPCLDGIMADLGVSSHQLDDATRGFSYRFDAPLDLRMAQGHMPSPTAAQWLATATEQEIAHVLSNYGELPQSRRLARALVVARAQQPLLTTRQLAQALEPLWPRAERTSRLSQVFQALRIHLNDELGVLEQLLQAAVHWLKPGGRLVVLSYHSLEDRLVKHYMASGRADGHLQRDLYGNALTPWRVLTRQVVKPTVEEVATNSRARSARLRAAERNHITWPEPRP